MEAPCSDLDMQAYWDELKSNSINAERLASYDRSITHEPDFAKTDTAQLRKDLEAYLATLSAVHGGHDLQAAALAVIGYKQVRMWSCYSHLTAGQCGDGVFVNSRKQACNLIHPSISEHGLLHDRVQAYCAWQSPDAFCKCRRSAKAR